MKIKAEISLYLTQLKESKIFFYLIIWLLCGLLVILRGNISHLAGIESLDIDLIPVFLVYLIAKDKDLSACCFAFFMGILTDILAPCPLGLFAFFYSAILLVVNQCRKFLDFNNIKTSILVVAAILLVKWCFFLIVLNIFPMGQFISFISFVLAFLSIAITGLITPLLFYFLDLIKGGDGQDYVQKGSLISF